jgi:hypothetical protein
MCHFDLFQTIDEAFRETRLVFRRPSVRPVQMSGTDAVDGSPTTVQPVWGE